ncbi:hypothetical protein BH10ACI2_BH10ACI2_04250 [soil metagenome]
MITPLEFIAMVRDIYPQRYQDASGGCLKFSRLLQAVFPDAKSYYNVDHVITEIDGEFYDVDGSVLEIGGFLPIEEYGDDFIEKTFNHVTFLA